MFTALIGHIFYGGGGSLGHRLHFEGPTGGVRAGQPGLEPGRLQVRSTGPFHASSGEIMRRTFPLFSHFQDLFMQTRSEPQPSSLFTTLVYETVVDVKGPNCRPDRTSGPIVFLQKAANASDQTAGVRFSLHTFGFTQNKRRSLPATNGT